MKLIAKRAFPYARKRLKPGDPFEASTADGKLLVMAGQAYEAPDEDEVPEAEVSPRTGKPKRRYKRRDMRAAE